jgi:hypothetical protein
VIYLRTDKTLVLDGKVENWSEHVEDIVGCGNTDGAIPYLEQLELKLYLYSYLDERLLASNPERFCSFLIKYPSIWEFCRKKVASFWTVDEIDLAISASNSSRRTVHLLRRNLVDSPTLSHTTNECKHLRWRMKYNGHQF